MDFRQKNPKRKVQQTIENKSSFTLVLFHVINLWSPK